MKTTKSPKPAAKAKKPTSRNAIEPKKEAGEGKGLTPKQEKFAQLISEGMSQADAYRGAFEVKPSTAAKTIHDNASQLMARTEIAQRVDALRVEIMSKVAEELSYDYQDAMNEFEQVRVRAFELDKLEAANTAIANKAKMSGLMVEDRKNDRSPVAGIAPDRAKAALEAIYSVRKAKTSAIA